MKITDAYVLKQLKQVNSYELKEMVESYPDDERDGRSDTQILADEVSWLLYKFNSEGYCHHDDLAEARRILRETKNGKEMPLNSRTLKPKYAEWEITMQKNTVNEYRRLTNLNKRLNDKGIYGKW